MSSQANIELARRFIDELWNQRKYEIADELFSEDFVTNSISNEPAAWEGKGPESMKNHIKHWLVAVPDMQFTAHNVIADERHFVIHWSAAGTNLSPFMGIPATGKPVKVLGMTISHVKDGKIALNQTIVDSLGFLQQLEALPDNAAILSQARE